MSDFFNGGSSLMADNYTLTSLREGEGGMDRLTAMLIVGGVVTAGFVLLSWVRSQE
jgi:hypothetical protein